MSLTDKQKKIINSSYLDKLVVKAGPGTGKTHCLIERFRFLVEKQDLDPVHEILVLSFSVAAAQEVRNRIKEAVEQGSCSDDLLFAKVRTFDSFATYFMLKLDPEIDLSGKNYDERIDMAVSLLENNPEAKEKMSGYRHIMVDEIQDLVGARAKLTQAVLRTCGSGFTLFGDPAQGIYDFLMGDDSEGPTSDDFLEWVKLHFENLDDDNVLDHNFRVEGNRDLESIAQEGRKLLLYDDAEKAYSYLSGKFSDLNSLGALNDLYIPENLQNSKTAILCRTNGQVLRLARSFQEKGIKFTIRKPPEEKIIPAWVGWTFLGWASDKIRKNEFKDLFTDRFEEPPMSWNQAWETLKEVEGERSKNSLSLLSLRREMRTSSSFPESALSEKDLYGVVLSTIHRSKGREFSNAIVVMSEGICGDEILQETRVLFVALTRAQKQLFKLSGKGAKGIKKPNGRWIRSYGGSFSGIEFGLENDIDIHSFVSSQLFEFEEDIEDNQIDLFREFCPGAPVRLELQHKADANLPVYRIKACINKIVVGLTSRSFGRALVNLIWSQQNLKPKKFPKTIDDLWVSEVVTEVGDLGVSDVPRKYRSTGLWLGVRIQGLGTCRDWS